MNTQPEALRLADALEDTDGAQDHDEAAAELRRLHEVNQMLVGALKAITTLSENDAYKIAEIISDKAKEQA